MEPNGARLDARMTRLENEVRNIGEGVRDIKRTLEKYELGALKQQVHTLARIVWGICGAAGLAVVGALMKLVLA